MNIRYDPEVDALYIELRALDPSTADELYLRVKIEQAEAAVAEGKVLSHEEVVKRSREWFK